MHCKPFNMYYREPEGALRSFKKQGVCAQIICLIMPLSSPFTCAKDDLKKYLCSCRMAGYIY